ncbi:sensor histidine kinase [Austwickia chelonae]|uniref:sensor histidine kinase n=1 Tax=Austwickia chelonae TaxID=100225 RepID=UPI0013C32A41|nr:sensor histidine kinase [Austwickia chelonae]
MWEYLWPGHGHVLVDTLLLVAAAAFGISMVTVIRRGHRLLTARHHELDVAHRHLAQALAERDRSHRRTEAVCDILLQITRRESLSTTLSSIATHARGLVDAADAGLCLQSEPEADGRVCIRGQGGRCCQDHSGDCPARERPVQKLPLLPVNGQRAGADLCLAVSAPPADGAITAYPVRDTRDLVGSLWVDKAVIEPGDDAFLRTLADLASVAIDQANLLDATCHAATLAERDRIAREMHDSLAQVLGVTHLRLQVLLTRNDVHETRQVSEELHSLADLCHDAYRDVRESILGLRESPRADQGLIDSLRIYVTKYSRQSCIDTRLENHVPADPRLSPHCEVQVIRVVQEALTNVRKHSGATTAVVRITETPENVMFEIEDDGRGFDPRHVISEAESFGLRSMQERCEAAGGQLTIKAAPGQGTRVALAVPRASGHDLLHEMVGA